MGTREYKEHEDIRLVLEWSTPPGMDPDPSLLAMYVDLLEYTYYLESAEDEDY